MIALNIRVSVDTVTPALNRVREGLSNENLLPFFAEVVAQEMTANFLSLDASRTNKIGAPKSGYYSQAAERVKWDQIDANRIVISSDQVGLSIKYFGGTIRAGKGTVMCGANAGEKTKYLTIPVVAEAYGMRACDFPGLEVFWGINGPWALGFSEKSGSIATQSGGSGGATSTVKHVLFVLKQEITIAPDPTILPSPTRLNASLRIAFNDYMALLWENAGRN